MTELTVFIAMFAIQLVCLAVVVLAMRRRRRGWVAGAVAITFLSGTVAALVARDPYGIMPNLMVLAVGSIVYVAMGKQAGGGGD
jgi:xanthine/uracil/vitamin C permease (AzgA family)